MTRINSAIPVRALTDEHLLAEHREIKRLPYYLNKAIESGSVNRIPRKFTLGKGHVLFFLDKQQFVNRRYHEIFNELTNRGFEPSDFSENWGIGIVYSGYYNRYTPTEEERHLLAELITERIGKSTKKVWHYYRKPITKEEAIALLTTQ